MNAIPFTKMCAAGNDFIIIDNRLQVFAADRGSELAERLCRRKFSIGADGLILVEESQSADFKWRFFNADGSEAEMCGNGGRCVARFAFLNDIASSTLTFETLAGVIMAEIMEDRVKLQLPLPFGLTCDFKLAFDGKDYLLNSITFGYAYHIPTPPLLHHRANLAVKTLMRQTLLNTRIHLDDHLRTRRIFNQQLTEVRLALLPGRLLQKPTSTSIIAF